MCGVFVMVEKVMSFVFCFVLFCFIVTSYVSVENPNVLLVEFCYDRGDAIVIYFMFEGT